jgi:hypothetical protein
MRLTRHRLGEIGRDPADVDPIRHRSILSSTENSIDQ